MAIDKILGNSALDQVADSVFSAVSDSVSEIKAMQKRKAAENVQIVVQALKKIESDLQDKYDGVTTVIEKRVASIKDGKDGQNGADGRAGKDGRPGRDGAVGPRGANGVDGYNGRDGVDGVSVTNAFIDFDGSLIINLSDGQALNVGEVVAPDLAEKIKVITNGGGTSQGVLDALASLQSQINSLIPSQTGNAGKFLTTNGTDVSWAQVAGGLSFQGTWNASTNTPTLASGVGLSGYYYITATAGSTNLDGVTDWQIGDWLLFNGTVWQKIDQSNLVTSVAGRTGAVVLNQADVSGTASLTTAQTLTNKTLTSPIINEILDTNGNEILGLSPTASATDFLTVKNGIGVGSPVHVYADGSSTNVGLHIQPKGTGLVTISDGTDFNKGFRFRSSGSSASAVTLLDAVATAGRVVTLPDATTTLVGRDTTDTLTNKTFGGNPTFSAGTANGVAYLNGSKVLTTGSALTFDGTNLSLGNNGTSFQWTNSGNNVAINATSGVLDFYTGTSAYNKRYTLAADGTAIWTIGSEQMRLTSTGLGIGTSSPSAKLDVVNASGRAARIGGFQFGGTTSSADGGNNLLGSGVYWNGSNLTATQTSGAVVQLGNGAIQFQTLSGLTAGSTYSFAPQLSLDSSGNLGLGVTPSAWAALKALQIGYGSISGYPGATGAGIWLASNAYYNGTNWVYQSSSQASYYNQLSGAHAWYNAPSGTAGNAISFTQAMTLDASGNLLVGTTSTVAGAAFVVSKSVNDYLVRFINSNATAYGVVVNYSGISPNSTGQEFLRCVDSTTDRMTVRSNGGIANFSGNNVNLSDRREKTNFAPAKSYLDTICAIPVQTFNYIDQNMEEDVGLTLGVVAQDVQAVAPEMVMESNWGTEEEPKMRLSIYQTDLQYALMKCIQEQQALITALTARVAALESN